MNRGDPRQSCGCKGGCDLNRRSFLKRIGAGASLAAMPEMAGPFTQSASPDSHPIPLDKKLAPAWTRALTERGVPTTYSGWEELRFIGMPVGGIGGGTVYIGGDGRLWCWDVFNEHHLGVVPNTLPEDVNLTGPIGGPINEMFGANFVDPPEQSSPWDIDQGFQLRVGPPGSPAPAPVHLNRSGFQGILFVAQYPIARLQYEHPDEAVRVELEAFTPFIPLDTERSSFPASILRYRVVNGGDQPIDAEISGWIRNPVLRGNDSIAGARRFTRTFTSSGLTGVKLSAEPLPAPTVDPSSAPEDVSLDESEDADRDGTPVEKRADFGSMVLCVVDDRGWATAPSPLQPNGDLDPNDATGIGEVGATVHVPAGGEAEIVFIVAWYFPNTRIPDFPGNDARRWYAAKYTDAQHVALDVADQLDELTRLTRLWHEAWYDSSLPHWLLERTLTTVDALQTNTCYRFADGRFWAWEGVGCCPGTCTHVWHYAQSVARLFPDLERDLRERTDFGVALRETDGMIRFRAEHNNRDATDGQAGIILRTLREHQTSPNDNFLRRVWPRCKKAIEYLISQDARDGEPDGIPVGEQHNTLDAEWFGKIPVLASLYLAAIRAGEAMATEIGDVAFAARCRHIHQRGRQSIETLFDEDRGYFVQEEDPDHREAIGIGTGCYIDQVMGQWWAFQLGLGRLYDQDMIRSALQSLWDYNFCPDMGLVREAVQNPRLRGRPYALAGDAGLVMCTWPFSGKRDDWEKHWQFGYFNECMTGFEYEVAGHMIWEGTSDFVEKGLAIVRAIHDRYDGRLRNPFNEIECSDHYARAMASYGVFLALVGFEYHGPRAHIGFAPRLNPENFRAAFTAAEGWGRYIQNRDGLCQTSRIELLHGKLDIRTIALEVPPDRHVDSCQLDVTRRKSAGEPTITQERGRVTLAVRDPVRIRAGDVIRVDLCMRDRP